jgi:SAM-dependent methyltransferase
VLPARVGRSAPQARAREFLEALRQTGDAWVSFAGSEGIAAFRVNDRLRLERPGALDAVLRWTSKASWWRAQLGATVRAPQHEPALGMLEDALDMPLEAHALSEGERAALGPWVGPGKRVLDIGCGGGRQAIALAALGAEVVAIDPSAALVEHARSITPSGLSVSFWVGALPVLEPDLGRFDLVYLASDVLQVLEDDEARVRGLEACARALVPGGRFVVPVRVSPPSRLVRWGIEAPRRVLRRMGWTAGAAPGERMHRWTAEGPWIVRRVFAARGEVEALLRTAELAVEGWVGDFLVARKPSAASPRYAPHPDVEAGTHDGALLLANLATGATFRMNTTGRRVWDALSRGCDRDAIVEEIAALPGASRERVARDVDALLAQLAARGLVIEGTSP